MCEVLHRLGAESGDIVFVAHGDGLQQMGGCAARADEPVQLLLGRVRLALAQWLEEKGELTRPATPNMLWVHDFPLYEQDSTDGSWSGNTTPQSRKSTIALSFLRWIACVAAMHHPFSAPTPADEPKLLAAVAAPGSLTGELGEVIGQCYDL